MPSISALFPGGKSLKSPCHLRVGFLFQNEAKVKAKIGGGFSRFFGMSGKLRPALGRERVLVMHIQAFFDNGRGNPLSFTLAGAVLFAAWYGRFRDFP